jgi:predicted nucleic acid-binding protein
MITAIDTNVLLDILVPDEKFFEDSVRALEDAATSGALVVCDLVYAELCTHFSAQRECDAFLESNEIRVESLSREAHFLASRTWRTNRKQSGRRTRILADLLIGAHAQTQATRLLLRDRGFYRRLFPSLEIFDPSGEKG